MSQRDWNRLGCEARSIETWRGLRRLGSEATVGVSPSLAGPRTAESPIPDSFRSAIRRRPGPETLAWDQGFQDDRAFCNIVHRANPPSASSPMRTSLEIGSRECSSPCPAAPVHRRISVSGPRDGIDPDDHGVRREDGDSIGTGSARRHGRRRSWSSPSGPVLGHVLQPKTTSRKEKSSTRPSGPPASWMNRQISSGSFGPGDEAR